MNIKNHFKTQFSKFAPLLRTCSAFAPSLLHLLFNNIKELQDLEQKSHLFPQDLHTCARYKRLYIFAYSGFTHIYILLQYTYNYLILLYICLEQMRSKCGANPLSMRSKLGAKIS